MNIVKKKIELSNQEKFNQIIDILEVISVNINKDINIFIKNWIISTSKYFFSSYPLITNKMSEELKSDFLKEVNYLAENIEPFEDDTIWWHKAQDKQFDYKNFHTLIEEKVRTKFGKLGYILEYFNFILKDKFDSEGFKCSRAGNNDYEFKYIYMIYWSKQIKIGFDHYNDNYKYAKEIIRQ